MEPLLLSVKHGAAPDGRIMAVITSGGHPRVDPGKPCTVCSVGVFDTDAEAHAWFNQMNVERPWESRQ
jgi:hypothetical protein